MKYRDLKNATLEELRNKVLVLGKLANIYNGEKVVVEINNGENVALTKKAPQYESTFDASKFILEPRTALDLVKPSSTTKNPSHFRRSRQFGYRII